jgi:hypothetical protein
MPRILTSTYCPIIQCVYWLKLEIQVSQDAEMYGWIKVEPQEARMHTGVRAVTGGLVGLILVLGTVQHVMGAAMPMLVGNSIKPAAPVPWS